MTWVRACRLPAVTVAVGVGVAQGCKGGNNSWNHAHMDVGSFVYDWNGQRWAEDMGADNYGL